MAASSSSSPVTWDKYSLSINGERLFVFAGEFHYLRLPVPELWLDVFQKLKANGFNAISVYFFWNYHSASEGIYDFESGAHNIQRLFDYAKETGIYIIARPGPYANGELSAGGFALWAANGLLGRERTSDSQYYNLWSPWMTEIGKIIAANQITEGGPVILVQHENELQETTHSANNTLVLYMEQILKVLADAGIVVPSTHNEKGMRSVSWSTDYENVGGAVNIYGLDSYPGGLSCTNPNAGFDLIRTYYQWFQNYSYTQPEFLPEFEGGYFTPWGDVFYDDCSSMLLPEYADVFYKNNIGSRITLQSLYMTYGGTNWGHIAAPVVYTSYDYNAPLRETREIRDKLKQTKLLGLFTRVSSDLLQTDMMGNGTGYTTGADIFTWALRNPETNAGFYVVAQEDSSSVTDVVFDLEVETSTGPVKISNIELSGRQSKIIATDYKVGDTTLLYCSTDILTYATLDVDVLVLYLNEGQTGTFVLARSSSGLKYIVYGNSTVTTSQSSHGTVYTYTQGKGVSAIKFSNGYLVYLLDKYTAWNFFAPSLVSSPIVKPDEHLFVIGPYLVREASIKDHTLELRGDNENTTSIEIYHGNPSISTITWNNKPLPTTRTAYGSLIGTIPGTEHISISLPKLTSWKSHNTIPEIDPNYDDSNWVVCDKKTTFNSIPPMSFPVLYSGDYGYHAGPKIYRGRFGNTNATGVNITAQNGYAAGWSAWLNGKYVGGEPGDPSMEATSAVLKFDSSNLKQDDTENVLTVLVDYTGHDEDNVRPTGAQNPRGLLGAVFQGPTSTDFTSWKIQGNAGGEKNIDPLRGPMNEGGLYGERLGWHLPGFKPSTESGWDDKSPSDGVHGASGRFYLTEFTFDLGANSHTLDVPIGIRLNASSTSGPAVVYVWLNGYKFAHYLPHIGPQTVFPFQPGILNIQGSDGRERTNTLAICIWAMTGQSVALDVVELVVYGKYVSSFNFGRDWRYLQPGWKDRSEYA
ncbi:beta-galactosidase, putative [Talaromyces stipitatus ATCC 10500]|uniref:beta-galactosidase n=1 Tax=Talaromyces stipitatus (strain ATCC 10500 / CBS 375.48 / QM 6759 / NRRL 1006) TaxID=441959 RepID=B8MKF6_TALSN|nr:beta-galactosidase, putative [Talaromyces stipitatus ATCC 10500]EED15311.1 beta-galactosidase, putative [Talaromyces stipitatus ATCC 10500]